MADIERWRAIVKARESGLEYKAIGELFGISAGRVCQIIKRNASPKEQLGRKPGPCANKVLCEALLERYGTLKNAAQEIGLAYRTIRKMLDNRRTTRGSRLVMAHALGMSPEELFGTEEV